MAVASEKGAMSLDSRDSAHDLPSTVAAGAEDSDTTKNAQEGPVDDESFLHGKALIPVMASLTLILFLAMLDISIIGTAVPKITSEFHRLEDVGWYVGAYQLTSGAVQPLTGKLFSHLNTKWTFLVFFLFFEIGSAICGASTSSIMIILGRVVAGLGVSGLSNGAITIVATGVQPAKRPFYTSILMGLSMLGILLGPLVGGLLTEHVTWRWCFYINLPVGSVAGVALALITVPEQRDKQRLDIRNLKHFLNVLDVVGFLMFAPAVVMLLLALQFGSESYGWGSAEVIGLFCGAAGLFVVFCTWEYRKGQHAMIPWFIVKQRLVWASCINYGFLMAGTVTVGIYTPLFLQAVHGLSPTMSAVYMLPAMFSQLFGVILSGALVVRLGYYIPWAAGGAALTAITAGIMSTWNTHSSDGQVLGYQALFFGRGGAIQMAIVAIQNGLPPTQIPVATALAIFCQNLFSAVFVVVANSIFQETLSKEIRANVPGISPKQAVAAGGSAEAVRHLAAANDADLTSVLDAYSKGFSNVFYLVVAFSIAGFVAAFGMGWIDLRKTRKKEPELESK